MTAPTPDSSTPPTAATAVRLDLPGDRAVTHRDVAANGARFHVAEVGDGPLVLLLHGFPQFWWTWRHQLTALADAGYRAVAMDLRGVGGSDRTPRGYDPANLALDITGVVRSLGEPDAALVGHDLGGYLAWTAAVMRPKLVRRLRGLLDAAPAPLARGDAVGLRPDPGEFAHLGLPAALPPRAAARGRRRGPRGAADQGVVRAAAARGRGPDGVPAGDVHPVHGALLGRAVPLDDAVHGAAGRAPVQPAHEAAGAGADAAPARFPRPGDAHAQRGFYSGQYVEAPYRWRLFDGLGHFPHEEDPAAFSTELVNWLKDPEPDR